MPFKDFWDEELVDEVVSLTNGSTVVWRGASFWMHLEQPTAETLSALNMEVRGVAVLLIGARSRFPEDIPRGELITVDGDDYVIGDWRNSDDGEDIVLALTRSTRAADF